MEIRRESFDSPAARALTNALEAELLATYDGVPGSGGLPDAVIFEPPTGAFLVGRESGEPVACGGIARYDEATAEIRRMYVVPRARRPRALTAGPGGAGGGGPGARLLVRPPGDGQPSG